MRRLFFILPLCILVPLFVRGQSAYGRVVDSATGRPIPGATLSDRSGRVITFSNDDGTFQLSGIPPGDTVKIGCLGYETYGRPYRQLLGDTLIRLHPVTYSLPPVFVGHYAVNLISKAYRKAAAARGKYFYGKALDLQFLFVDGKVAECYEFLENTQTSVEGLVAREVSAVRYGVIRSRTDSLSISTIRSLVYKLNWYDGKDRLNKVLKDNDFTVESLIRWDTDEIAKIHFVSKKHGLFHRNSEGYYYIDTRTYDVVRYEVSAFIPKINLLIIKFHDVRLHATENYARKTPFAPMANTTLSITYSTTNPYSQKLDTLRFYEKIYNTRLTSWSDKLVFRPTDLRTKNGQLSHGYDPVKWKDTLPVKLSRFESETLRDMADHHGFQ